MPILGTYCQRVPSKVQVSVSKVILPVASSVTLLSTCWSSKSASSDLCDNLLCFVSVHRGLHNEEIVGEWRVLSRGVPMWLENHIAVRRKIFSVLWEIQKDHMGHPQIMSSKFWHFVTPSPSNNACWVDIIYGNPMPALTLLRGAPRIRLMINCTSSERAEYWLRKDLIGTLPHLNSI